MCTQRPKRRLLRRGAILLLLAALAALAAPAPAQGGGLRGPQAATPGSTIRVEVAGNDPSVELIDPSTGDVSSHPVDGKTATVPIPNTPGAVLVLRVGRGLRARCWVVEVTS